MYIVAMTHLTTSVNYIDRYFINCNVTRSTVKHPISKLLKLKVSYNSSIDQIVANLLSELFVSLYRYWPYPVALRSYRYFVNSRSTSIITRSTAKFPIQPLIIQKYSIDMGVSSDSSLGDDVLQSLNKPIVFIIQQWIRPN